MIDNKITVPEIADVMEVSVKTVRNRYLPEIKVKCDHWKVGRTVKVDRAHFDRYYDNEFLSKRRA